MRSVPMPMLSWDPKRALKLSHENLHMRVDYAVYPDKMVPGSPRFVFSRGELVIDKAST